jgi:hypothetical protein
MFFSYRIPKIQKYIQLLAKIQIDFCRRIFERLKVPDTDVSPVKVPLD